MLAKYSDNQVEIFSNILCNEIKNYVKGDFKEYSDIDPIAKLILLNNGCTFDNNSKSKDTMLVKEDTMLIEENTFGVLFITNAKGNKINKIYDVFEINGTIYFTIFLDTFYGINKSSDENESFITSPDLIFGKSAYFMDIYNLTLKFIKLTMNPVLLTSEFINTSASYNSRINPLIVAGRIILEICGDLTDLDVEGSGISAEELKEYISHYRLSLYGIRVKE